MIYKKRFKNQQQACEALAEKDCIKWCDKMGFPYKNYDDNLRMEIKITDSKNINKYGFHSCLVEIRIL